MLFSKILGQTSSKQRLRDMVQRERIPHAQLFLGSNGSGTLALALAFIQYALCEGARGDDSCGECGACQKMIKRVHPDVHFSYPTIGAGATSGQFATEWRAAMAQNPYLNLHQWLQKIGAENKQGNINKDECLSIVKKLSLKAFEGKFKILLMWLPEYLGKEGNRLLKLIEEPPDDTLFILVAEQQELILNTIISRCQIVQIYPLQDEDVAEGLVRKIGLTWEKARALAPLADGNLNEALTLASQTDHDLSMMFVDWMRKCFKGDGAELVPWVEKFATQGRENQKYFLQYGLHFLREMMRWQVGNNQLTVRLQAAELTVAQKMSQIVGLEKVAPIATLFDDCSRHVERNANPKILFLDASIQLHKILKS